MAGARDAPRPNSLAFQEGPDEVTAEPLVLIVVPTRELAIQILNEARKFCYRTMLRPSVIYRDILIREQIGLLGKGCDALIRTPGRLVDFIQCPKYLTRELAIQIFNNEAVQQAMSITNFQSLLSFPFYIVRESTMYIYKVRLLYNRVVTARKGAHDRALVVIENGNQLGN